MSPSRVVPTAQQRAFELALAERLDVDPTATSLASWRVDDQHGVVALEFRLDADELLEIFNTGRTEHRSLRTRVQDQIDALCTCSWSKCPDAEVRSVLAALLDPVGSAR